MMQLLNSFINTVTLGNIYLVLILCQGHCSKHSTYVTYLTYSQMTLLVNRHCLVPSMSQKCETDSNSCQPTPLFPCFYLFQFTNDLAAGFGLSRFCTQYSLKTKSFKKPPSSCLVSGGVKPKCWSQVPVSIVSGLAACRTWKVVSEQWPYGLCLAGSPSLS